MNLNELGLEKLLRTQLSNNEIKILFCIMKNYNGKPFKLSHIKRETAEKSKKSFSRFKNSAGKLIADGWIVSLPYRGYTYNINKEYFL